MVHLLPSSIFTTRWIDIRKWLGDRYGDGWIEIWKEVVLNGRVKS